MDVLINFLINDYISSYIIRCAIVAIVALYCGGKIYNFQRGCSLKVKTEKYDYIRKMFYDYEKSKKVFFFSLQEYIGLELEEEEMEHLVKHNFYLFSGNLKHAYPKLMFRYNEYHLKHSIIGPLWAVMFYMITVIPVLLYLVFFPSVKGALTSDLFFTLNAGILPVFIFFSAISIYNLSSLGSAKCICNYYNN
jgi:hypothetical protein